MGSNTNPEIVSRGDRLDSWKEIAAYLGRSERTVRRWEDQEGLPVHRLAHEKRGSVYAYRSELDTWWTSRKEEIADEEEVSAINTPAPELNADWDRPMRDEPPTEGGRQSQQPTLESPSAAAPLKERPTRVLWAITGLLTVALAVTISIAYRATRSQPLRPLMRLPIELDAGMQLARSETAGLLALSPDGLRLAVTFRGSDRRVRIGTRALNERQMTPLAGTEEAGSPFFSSDGQWIGFFADGKLKKISVHGGAVVIICDAPDGRGASWADDGNIVVALSAVGTLSRVRPSAGEKPVPVTRFNPGDATHRWPQVLPGSHAVLFTAHTAATGDYDNANIDVVSLHTGERKTIQRGGFSAQYISISAVAGYLIYVHRSTLFAAPFDVDRLALTGAPVPLLEDANSSWVGGGDFAFAHNGTFIYLPGRGTIPGYPILWLESSGKTQPLHSPAGVYFNPRFSPDGKRLAFVVATPQGSDIWVRELDRDTPRRLTFLPGQSVQPVWTPDGENIVFRFLNPTAPGMYMIRSDGSGEARRLTDGKLQETPYSFSPDGRRLAFQGLSTAGSFVIFTVALEGDSDHPRLGKPDLFLGTTSAEVSPAFSPDGRWLAYSSNQSGMFETYVRPFPGPGGQWQISNGGGQLPVWSRNGRELLFRSLDGRIMTVACTASGDSFSAGKPHAWSDARVRFVGNLSTYDLAPDGKRLAVLPPEDVSNDQEPAQLIFLLNFTDEIERFVSGGKR